MRIESAPRRFRRVSVFFVFFDMSCIQCLLFTRTLHTILILNFRCFFFVLKMLPLVLLCATIVGGCELSPKGTRVICMSTFEMNDLLKIPEINRLKVTSVFTGDVTCYFCDQINLTELFPNLIRIQFGDDSLCNSVCTVGLRTNCVATKKCAPGMQIHLFGLSLPTSSCSFFSEREKFIINQTYECDFRDKYFCKSRKAS